MKILWKSIKILIPLVLVLAVIFFLKQLPQAYTNYIKLGGLAIYILIVSLIVIGVVCFCAAIVFLLAKSGGGSATSGGMAKKIAGFFVVITILVLAYMLLSKKFLVIEFSPFHLLFLLIPLWIFRLYLEYTGEYSKNNPAHVTVNMLCLLSLLLALGTSILQAAVPNWWENLSASAAGKVLLFSLVPLFLLTYILPGTGDGMVKWSKKLAVFFGIIIILGLVYSTIIPEIPKLEPAAQVQKPAFNPAPFPALVAVQAAPLPPPPHWETIERKYVELNKFSVLDGGFVKIAEVSAENERYLVEVESSDFQQFFIGEGGREIWEAIGPEGKFARYFPYKEKLPFPEKNLGGRIIKFDHEEPEFMGRRIEKSFNRPGTVTISISTNMPQEQTHDLGYSVEKGFVRNKGGDWVVVKKFVVR